MSTQQSYNCASESKKNTLEHSISYTSAEKRDGYIHAVSGFIEMNTIGLNPTLLLVRIGLLLNNLDIVSW